MNKFSVNQIVRGIEFGYWVILGFRMIDGIEYAQLKEVNPKNFAETAPGEIALPLTCIQTLDEEINDE